MDAIMDSIASIITSYGLPGVVIIALSYVIKKYLLPTILKIGETNEKQAASLVKVSENLAKIANDLPDQLDIAKQEILEKIESLK